MNLRHTLNAVRNFFFTLVPYGIGSRLITLFLSLKFFKKLFYRKKLTTLTNTNIGGINAPPHNDASQLQFILCNQFFLWRLRSLANLPPEKFLRYVTFENLNILKKAKQKGTGIILVNYHYGATRIIPMAICKQGYPLHSIEAGNTLKKLNSEQEGLEIIEVGVGAKFLLKQTRKAQKLLKKGKILHMLPDGLQGDAGKEVEFMGKKRRISTSFAELAIDTNATIVPISAEFTDGSRIKIKFYHELALEGSNRQEVVNNVVHQYKVILESLWHMEPGGVRDRHLLYYRQLPEV
jgi:hypothetical protein